MELREASESLIAPGFTIQLLGKNGTKSLRAYYPDDLCFYQGSVRSRVNSSVALSTCMGMVSLHMQRSQVAKGGLDEREGADMSDFGWRVFFKMTQGSVHLKECPLDIFILVLAAFRLITVNTVIALPDL